MGTPAAVEGFRLRAGGYRFALLVHILGAVGWFGIAVFVLFAAAVAVTATDAPTPGALYRAIELAPWLYGPTVAHVVVLTIATVLSVFKPGSRTPWSKR